jgi:AmmeMemoRadiSam system protein B/AmmeMemoRadiSam system protein A
MNPSRPSRPTRPSPHWARRVLCFAAVCTLGLPILTTNSEAQAMTGKRPSALAGTWYSADPRELAQSIDEHLERARPLSEVAARPPVAFIVPHAGHQWSGDAAAQLYRLFAGPAGHWVTRVILIGPSHYQAFRGASVMPVVAYQTPLGDVPVDTAVVAALLKQPGFQTVRSADAQEHCLEIQLPFLQRVLERPFQIVPILLSSLDYTEWAHIAKAVAAHVDEHTLIIASSDFTHYGDRFGYVPFRDDLDMNLRRLDLGAIETIVQVDPQALEDYKQKTDISVCGYRPIGVLLEILRNEKLWPVWGGQRPEARVLDYYRSADLVGDFNGSVSYAAIGFFRTGDLLPGPLYPPRLSAVAEDAPLELNAAEKTFLLDLARRTLREKLEHNRTLRVESFPAGVSAEKLRTVCGVFVTLQREGQLRGCIGSIEGREPLCDGVIRNAINAALEDPRFPPVELEELGDLHIEISVLTPLREVAGPQEIEVGRHGVVLERNGRRAVFLPQVAPEQGWDRDTMLTQLARKAGLPGDAWREGAKFKVFEALVFEEEPH